MSAIIGATTPTDTAGSGYADTGAFWRSLGAWPVVELPGALGSALAGALDAPGQSSAQQGSTASGAAMPQSGAGSGAGGGSSAPGAWTYKLPAWLQTLLFRDWMTGKDGRTGDSSLKGLIVLILFFVLGAGFIYVGVTTLAE